MHPPQGEEMLADYASLGLTLGAHPMSLLRSRLVSKRRSGSKQLMQRKDGVRVRAAGVVSLRQRPAPRFLR